MGTPFERRGARFDGNSGSSEQLKTDFRGRGEKDHWGPFWGYQRFVPERRVGANGDLRTGARKRGSSCPDIPLGMGLSLGLGQRGLGGVFPRWGVVGMICSTWRICICFICNIPEFQYGVYVSPDVFHNVGRLWMARGRNREIQFSTGPTTSSFKDSFLI